MQTFEVVLVRITQFFSALFFTFIVFLYAGGAILIPLGLLMAVIDILSHGIGFNGIFATVVAVPAVGWVLLRFYKIPGLADLLVETGWSLVKAGADNFRRYDRISRGLRGEIQEGGENAEKV